MNISKYIYLGIFSTLALTSCQEEDVKDPIINIQFPDLIEYAMDSNKESADTIAITFDVPTKWDLTSSASDWVRFLDGDRTYPSLAGQSGKQTVRVVISPNKGFNTDSATVELAVAGQKQVVASIVRGEITPTLSISLVNTDTGVTTPLDRPQVAMDWNETNFRYSAQLQVEANYDWELENIPSWIAKETLIQEGAANKVVTLSLRANYAGYTTEDMTAELAFVHKRNPDVLTTLEVQAETLIGKVRIYESETEYFNGLTVNADGVFIKDEIVTEAFDLNILSGEAIHFMAYEGSVWGDEFYFGIMNDMGIPMYPKAEWVTISADEKNEDEIYSSAAILHKNLLTFSQNEGKERIAGLLAIPQSIYDMYGENIESYIDSEGAVKEEFAKAGCYVTHLTQSPAEGQGGLSFAYPTEGASIRPLTEADGDAFFIIHYEYGVDMSGLNQLTYINPTASESTMILTPGATAAFVPNQDHAWLQVEFMSDFEGQGPACMIIINKNLLPADTMYPLQGQVVLRDASWVNKYGINVVLESRD